MGILNLEKGCNARIFNMYITPQLDLPFANISFKI